MSKLEVDAIEPQSGTTLTIGASGDSVTLGSGASLTSPGLTLSDNILFNAASKGIYLGVTTATASNLLDDYEEGTWTPTSFSSGYTASTASGTYTKIGDTVFIRALLNFSGVDASSNSKCNFDGLPFTATLANSGVAREGTTTGAIFMVRLGAGTVGEINSMDGISTGSTQVLATGRNYVINGFYKI